MNFQQFQMLMQRTGIRLLTIAFIIFALINIKDNEYELFIINLTLILLINEMMFQNMVIKKTRRNK